MVVCFAAKARFFWFAAGFVAYNFFVGKSIGCDFRGIERGIADRAVPALAATGNGGHVKSSVELAPDELAGFAAGGMAVHINDVHTFSVLCLSPCSRQEATGSRGWR